MYKTRPSNGGVYPLLTWRPFDSSSKLPLRFVRNASIYRTATGQRQPEPATRQRPIQSRGRPVWHKPSQDALPFRPALHKATMEARAQLADAPIAQHLEKEGRSFTGTFEDFERKVIGQRVAQKGLIGTTNDLSMEALNAAHSSKGHDGLLSKIKYGFYGYVSGLRFTKEELANQQTLADLRYPAEWYSSTRKMQRKVHLHVGPTNSGKTYHALKSLEAANFGMYAGPLRLLAHEVYSRMNAKGKTCALVTGEERRLPEGIDRDNMEEYITSCTVEMVNMNMVYDVAVIDEIQMLGNEDRGWAWTQAMLGVRAHELHLCGETRTVPLVKQLCAMSGDELIIHNYDRLSPLEMGENSLRGNLGALRKGDCIVSFSVMGIHSLRKAIEQKTGRKVAIVYGSLPPETRAQQARLFNDPDNDYDFLVASDAIGMGLNLSIKRIIFETTIKFDGNENRVIDTASIKQIAGRAGRYKSAQDDGAKSERDQDLSAAKGETAEDVNITSEESSTGQEVEHLVTLLPPPKVSPFETALKSGSIRPAMSTDKANVGIVTTLYYEDFSTVKAALNKEPPPIRTSGIFPPPNLVDRFAQCFPPGTPFSYVMLRLNEISQLNHRFHLCGLKDSVWIADLIEPFRNISTADRIVFTNAPAGGGERKFFNLLIPELATAVQNQSGGALYDVMSMPLEVLEEEVVMTRSYLRRLEVLHKGIVLYLWLSFRFHGIFYTRALADEVKQRVEERIETVLAGLSVRRRKKRPSVADVADDSQESAEEAFAHSEVAPAQQVDGHDEQLFDDEVEEPEKTTQRRTT